MPSSVMLIEAKTANTSQSNIDHSIWSDQYWIEKEEND